MKGSSKASCSTPGKAFSLLGPRNQTWEKRAKQLGRGRDLWLWSVFGDPIDGNWENKYSGLLLLHSFDLVLVLNPGWKARSPADAVHSGQPPRAWSSMERGGEWICRGMWKIFSVGSNHIFSSVFVYVYL